MVQLIVVKQKAKVVLVTSRRKRNTIIIRIHEYTISSKPINKNLGMISNMKSNKLQRLGST